MIWRTYVTVTLCIKPIYLWLSFCQIPLLSTAGGCGNCPGPRENYSGRWSELVMAEDDCLSAAPRKPCSLGLYIDNGMVLYNFRRRRPYDAHTTQQRRHSSNFHSSAWKHRFDLRVGDYRPATDHFRSLMCMDCCWIIAYTTAWLVAALWWMGLTRTRPSIHAALGSRAPAITWAGATRQSP